MHPLSLAALTVLELTPDEQIICAHDCGYQGVGLRLIPATPQETYFSLLRDAARLKKVKSLINSTGIKVFDIEIFRLKPDTNLKDFIPFLELGAELGTKNMLVAGNNPDRNSLIDQWSLLCEISRAYGIKPHMEPMPWTDVKSYLDAVSLIETNPDWGAVLIDPIHFFRSKGDCSQIQESHVSKMGYIQLADAPSVIPDTMEEILRQAREDRLPPGLGGFPLRGLLEKMASDMPISVEVPLAARWGCASANDKANLVRKHTLKLLDRIKDASV